MTLLQKLTNWQKSQARREGIEGYMVLPFAALKAIAADLPQSEEELLAVKGIGPVKVRKYGKDILALVAGGDVAGSDTTAQGISHNKLAERSGAFAEAEAVNAMLAGEDYTETVVQFDDDVVTQKIEKPVAKESEMIDQKTGEVREHKQEDALSVADFVGQINQVMGSYFSSVRVRGEVIGFKRNQNGHAYFELKDQDAIIRCSVFRDAYERSAVRLEDGAEVIITGSPSHHARYGFSFIGEFVELAGEGALKKAYDDLKKKLASEGLLAENVKRSLPELPERIGLITSPTGAAIGDFTMNVGKFGYKIQFHPSSVEGAKAVKELLEALKVLATKNLDLLVITRGGGSLESLQAFNNENVVRAIRNFPVPVIAGIGHEQDETLSTLVADMGVSTPTAAARTVRASWDEAISRMDGYEQKIFDDYSRVLYDTKHVVYRSGQKILRYFEGLIQGFYDSVVAIMQGAKNISHALEQMNDRVGYYEKILQQNDPKRLLKLGYGIVENTQGDIVRSVNDMTEGDEMIVHVVDGDITSCVKKLNHKK